MWSLLVARTLRGVERGAMATKVQRIMTQPIVRARARANRRDRDAMEDAHAPRERTRGRCARVTFERAVDRVLVDARAREREDAFARRVG